MGALLAALLALLALWSWRLTHADPKGGVAGREGPARRPAPQPPLPSPARSSPSARRSVGAQPAPGCMPASSTRCHQGDLWSVDSCGALERKLDECGPRACSQGGCELPDDEPCEAPPEGRCAGDTVELCVAGMAREVDCAARGLRCVQTGEGAQCARRVAPELRCTGGTRCEQDVLVQCEEGTLVRTDCSALRAECLVLPGASLPSCVKTVDAKPVLDCGPCGCPPDPGARELACDGRDEDGDRLIDEELACAPVPVLAFVLSDAAGGTSHAEEDVYAEIERVNRLYAQTSVAGALQFQLEELVWLQDSALLEIDDREFAVLVDDARVHPPRPHFYIPLVFTDAFVAGGGVPKMGASTLPNGSCGSMQQSAGPDVGVIVVAKARSDTTVAHELGHFLGLCHTHDQFTDSGRVAVRSEGGALEACSTSCAAEGDGVCDTPLDPGPEQCVYGAGCEASCQAGDEPDTANLMSYYTECRRRFSDDQVRLMQHTLALRRGWHACHGGACACELGSAVCPAGMSCRPSLDGAAGASCSLDGPRPAGADCRGASDCGASAMCAKGPQLGNPRCVRLCATSAAGCDCKPAGDDLSICVEDLSAG